MTAGFPGPVGSDITRLSWVNRRLQADLEASRRELAARDAEVSELVGEIAQLTEDLTVAVERAFRREHVLRAIRPLVGVRADPPPATSLRPPLVLTWFGPPLSAMTR